MTIDNDGKREAIDGEDRGSLTDRRSYLKLAGGALGTVATAGLAGCSGVFGQQSATDTAANGAGPKTNGKNATRTDTATPSPEANGTVTNGIGTRGTVTNTAGNATSNANVGAGKSPYTEVYRNTIGSVVLIKDTTPRGTAEGTGFAYDSTHIVTNAHVVRNANSIRLRFSNNAYHHASVVGTDVSSDLAVLKTTIPSGVTPLSIHTDQPAIGTEVLAIGNPYGNYGTASAGIVSAVNQSIPAQNGYDIPDAIQTDAAVNPGNSGGPLMNLAGEVLGVVNSERRFSQNIAFAVSSALLHRVVPALIKNGAYHHAYLGVRLGTVTPGRADQLGLSRDRGVYVDGVVPGGPADGTIRSGDVIVSIGGKKTDTDQQLSSYLALKTSPDDTIPVTVIRNGSKKTLRLKLGSRPSRAGTNAGSATTTR